MDGGWRSWDENNRSNNQRRPPHPHRAWHSAVTQWEQKFCTSVCKVPWWKICAAKSSMTSYKKVVDWDDSAALEAFQNAKSRYWAEINHVPSDIPLPDPDLYIEKVDHSAVIDPKLVEDLEKRPPPLPDENTDKSNTCGSSGYGNKLVPGTGWDDLVHKTGQIQVTGWGDVQFNTGWGDRGVQDCAWRGGGDCSSWNNQRPLKPDNWNNEQETNNWSTQRPWEPDSWNNVQETINWHNQRTWRSGNWNNAHETNNWSNRRAWKSDNWNNVHETDNLHDQRAWNSGNWNNVQDTNNLNDQRAWKSDNWNNVQDTNNWSNEQDRRNSRKRSGDHYVSRCMKSRHINNQQTKNDNRKEWGDWNASEHPYDTAVRQWNTKRSYGR